MEKILSAVAETSVEYLISRFGKQLLDYWLSVSIAGDTDGDNEHQSPTFSIVGLGRCGCHVTAELSEMIASSRPDKDDTKKRKQKDNWLISFFKKDPNDSLLQFNPKILIGDIDETSFGDFDGLLAKGGVSEEARKACLKLNYRPLGEGGVGHVPVFAQFLSRALLLLPDNKEKTSEWDDARNFMLSFRQDRIGIPRLVFYVFSAGGGTGAGSAAELMRAQNFAKACASIDREIYFSGVAILPQDITNNQRKLANTGRTVIQYLADLNLELDSPTAYDNAPSCLGGAYISNSPSDPGKTGNQNNIMPWNSLALISNDIMTSSSSSDETFEEVHTKANRYIAQQIFNIAAAQFPAAQFEKDTADEKFIQKKNYQAVRLDPNDLKTGLNGPYAVAFAAADSDAAKNSNEVIDKMYLRALSLPNITKLECIEGISVSPKAREAYGKIIDSINTLVETKYSQGQTLEESDFAELKEIGLFSRCPRLLYSFTAPQRSDIPNSYQERLDQLIGWTFPNLVESRAAISWGTTANYTLSIYIEGSVLLAPDVQTAVINYLHFCWQQRRCKGVDFIEQYQRFIKQDAPIDSKEVKQWLGEKENYKPLVVNYDLSSHSHNSRWRQYLDDNLKGNKDYDRLNKHSVDSVLINYEEVAAALRYLNYVNHIQKVEVIDFNE